MTVFTMRICKAADQTLVAHGQSHPEEDWNRTFIRLLRGSLPPGAPSRQVIHARLRDGPTGGAHDVVITSFTDGNGNVHCDLPLTVHIERSGTPARAEAQSSWESRAG